MALAFGAAVARLHAPLRRSHRRCSRAVHVSAHFPVFEKMVGTWHDSVRYVAPDLVETEMFHDSDEKFLTGERTISIADDVVTLTSATTFPDGRTLNLKFHGKRVAEAFGLRNVVRFDRVPLDGEEAHGNASFPIALLAAEHPKPPHGDENAAFDVIIVREVMVGTGKTVLAETITLLDEGCCEASYASQEIDADTGGLGGVQLWRSVKRR